MIALVPPPWYVVLWTKVKAVSQSVRLSVLQYLGWAPYSHRTPDMYVSRPWSPQMVILLDDR